MSIEAELRTHLKSHHPCELTLTARLNTGFGIEGFRGTLTLKAGGQPSDVAIKFSPGNTGSDLTIEAAMLRDLKSAGWPVPEVYLSDEKLLVMAWVGTDGAPMNKIGQRHFGEQLAALHSKTRPHFGYPYETRIGPLIQPKGHETEWLPFFKDQRLLFMAAAASKQGHLPESLHQRLISFAVELDRFLPEPAHPSLIHGDLWGGNILSQRGELSGLIDPAIYHAHPEIELAFTQMFHSLGPDFFDGYQSHTPLEKEFFSERIEIYNLYPTLVHVRLFGAGYLPPIDATLRRFGF